MDGVILFADDKIHIDSPENKFFNALKTELPVVGVHTIELAEKTTSSIGTFSAVIMDWQFETEEDRELKAMGVTPKSNVSFDFLMNNDFYSLVYVYSDRNDIENSSKGEELKSKYKERIQFSHKAFGDIETEKKRVLNEIRAWKNAQAHLSIPLLWSKSINRYTQKIFTDLSNADKNWIKYIYDSAKSDGVSAELFVLDIFQYLLSERLIEDIELLESIKKYAKRKPKKGQDDESSISKLFQTIYYTKISNKSPIMTGDIFELKNNEYGILITPECNIKDIIKLKASFDIIKFSEKKFDDYLFKNNNEFLRTDFATYTGPKGKKKIERTMQVFNNEEQKFHILPSFPNVLNLDKESTISCNFYLDTEKVKYTKLKKLNRNYKLNSPFIQQLRQRYIAYFGRVGVPALPEIVRLHNLK